ncbi:MAG: LCP family protein [Candidatus Bipolaricaulia bacterium]
MKSYFKSSSERRRRKWKRRLMIAGIILVVLAVGVQVYTWQAGKINRLFRRGERANILVFGIDADRPNEQGRSDTIVLVSIAKDGEMNLLSIPRDTRLKFPDGRWRKVNAAYAIGGSELARQVISDFLGLPSKSQFYISMDYRGFERLVDLLGGVTIDVDKHLKYDDVAGNLHIDIPPGRQHLTGKEAMGYVRFRHDQLGDIGRIRRQQKFAKALLDIGIQFDTLWNLKALIDTAIRYVDTNLSLVDLYTMMKLLRRTTFDTASMAQIPGIPVQVDGISYLEPDIVKTAELVNRLIRGIDMITRDEIKVGVLNGNGVQGLAHNVAQYLSAKEFQVVHIGNADSFEYPRSYLVNLSGDLEKARMLMETLGDVSVELVSPGEFEAQLTQIQTQMEQEGVSFEGTDLVFIFGRDFTF